MQDQHPQPLPPLILQSEPSCEDNLLSSPKQPIGNQKNLQLTVPSSMPPWQESDILMLKKEVDQLDDSLLLSNEAATDRKESEVEVIPLNIKEAICPQSIDEDPMQAKETQENQAHGTQVDQSECKSSQMAPQSTVLEETHITLQINQNQTIFQSDNIISSIIDPQINFQPQDQNLNIQTEVSIVPECISVPPQLLVTDNQELFVHIQEPSEQQEQQFSEHIENQTEEYPQYSMNQLQMTTEKVIQPEREQEIPQTDLSMIVNISSDKPKREVFAEDLPSGNDSAYFEAQPSSYSQAQMPPIQQPMEIQCSKKTEEREERIEQNTEYDNNATNPVMWEPMEIQLNQGQKGAYFSIQHSEPQQVETLTEKEPEKVIPKSEHNFENEQKPQFIVEYHPKIESICSENNQEIKPQTLESHQLEPQNAESHELESQMSQFQVLEPRNQHQNIKPEIVEQSQTISKNFNHEENRHSPNKQQHKKLYSSMGICSNVFVHNEASSAQKEQNQAQQLQQEAENKIPLPLVPPCITINIRKNNEISLSIFSNSTPNRIEKPSFENKEVQNDSTLIEFNDSFDSEIRVQETSERKVQCIKEKKPQTNISFLLDKSEQIREEKTIRSIGQKNEPISKQFSTVEIQFPQKIDHSLQTSDDSEEIYRKICYYADSYLLNKSPEEKDHLEFQEQLKNHISSRLSTEPISPIGDRLFKNGLVLTAIVKLIAKQRSSPYLIHYLFQHFSSISSLEVNQFVFREAAQKARQEYICYMQGQYLERMNKRIQSENIPLNEGPIIRSSMRPLGPLQQKPFQADEKIIQQKTKLKNLTLNSNYYSISQRVIKPASVRSKEGQPSNSKNNDVNPFVRRSAKIQNKFEAIVEATEKSSQSESDIEFKSTQKAPENSQMINNERSTQSISQKEESPPKEPEVESKKSKTKGNSFSKRKEEEEENNNTESSANIPTENGVQNVAARFNHLYQRYRQIRESIKASGSPANKSEELTGILKAPSGESKEKTGEFDVKKKKNVQFLEDPMEISKAQPVEQEENKNKKKKKASRSRVQNSVEETTAQEASVRPTRRGRH